MGKPYLYNLSRIHFPPHSYQLLARRLKRWQPKRSISQSKEGGCCIQVSISVDVLDHHQDDPVFQTFPKKDERPYSAVSISLCQACDKRFFNFFKL
jgi:hypothetical protein